MTRSLLQRLALLPTFLLTVAAAPLRVPYTGSR